MRGALAVCLCAPGLACQDVVELPTPSTEGLGSALVAYLEGEDLRRLEAYDLQKEPLKLASFSHQEPRPDAPASMVLLGFACPLAALGLKAGVQDLAEAPVSGSFELPGPTSVQRLRIAAGERWSPAAIPGKLGEDLRRAALPPGHLCASYGALLEMIPVRFEGDPAFMVTRVVESALATQDGAALISVGSSTTHDDRASLYRVDAAGNTSRASLAYRIGGRARPFPRGRLAYGADRSLWMVTQSGSVAHGTMSTGLDVVGQLRWLGSTPSSTISATLENVALLSIGGEERLLAGFSWDGGFYLDHAEGAVLAYVEGGAPELVDSLRGLAHPTLAPSSDGGVLVSGLGLLTGRLREAKRDPSGTWTVRDLSLPEKPAFFGEDSRAPGVVIARPGGGSLVAIGSAGYHIFRTCEYLSMASFGLASGEQGQWRWLSASFAAGMIPTDVVELPGRLVVVGGVAPNRRAQIVVYQEGARVCGALDFKRQIDSDNCSASSLSARRPAVVMLNPDTVLAIPGESDDSGVILKRKTRAPSCLGGT